jgi:hypothetical protein
MNTDNPTILEAIQALRALDKITKGEDKELEAVEKMDPKDWRMSDCQRVIRIYGQHLAKPQTR